MSNEIADAILDLAGALRRLGVGDAHNQGALEGHTMLVTEALSGAASTIADGLREGAEIIAEAIREARDELA